MTKFRPLLAVLACGVIVATACGSDSNSSSTTAASSATAGATATTAAGTATTAAATGTTPAASETTAAAGGAGSNAGVLAAQGVVDQYSKADGTIGVKIPLTGKPPKKTFAWMECDVPTCASYLTPGIKDATAALG